MTEAETIAKGQLDRIADSLEAIRFQLLGVRASLPASPVESVRLLEVEEMDSSTQLHTTIDCVLEDRLGPAIRDLRWAASERGEAAES
jgi:hypothetical protein